MYSRNSKGSKTNLCGTLQVIFEMLNAKPLIDTNYFQPGKYDLNHLLGNPRIP